MSAEQDPYGGTPTPGADEVRRLTEEWLVEREMAALTEAEVQEHVSEVMFDTHDADPDCLLCQRGVELGVWARYGYPNGPWVDGQGECR